MEYTLLFKKRNDVLGRRLSNKPNYASTESRVVKKSESLPSDVAGFEIDKNIIIFRTFLRFLGVFDQHLERVRRS